MRFAFRTILAGLALLGMLVLPHLLPHTAAAEDRRVLVLNSYHQGYKWTDDTVRGISAALAKEPPGVKLYVEYMGTKWSSSQEYFLQLKNIYREKFNAVRFDLIIATDNDALNFLLNHRSVAFGEVPVVFCGVNWFQPEQLRGQKNYTGVNEDADIAATVEAMLRLHPRTTEIFVIIDTTTTGEIVYRKAQEVEHRYTGTVRFTYLRNLPISRIAETLANAPADSIALMTLFQRDSTGAFFEFSESTSLISNASRVPLYGIWDFNLGFGIVGGMLTSGFEQGNMAGTLARRILAGEHADAVPVVMQSPNRYLFDYLQMDRFKIPKTSLPQGSVVINEPSSFYTVNKGFVWATIAGSVFSAVVIIVLLANIRRRKDAEALLRKAHDELELRVEERTADLGTANQMLLMEIAERKAAEQKLDRQNAQLERANQSLKEAQSQMLHREKMASIGVLAAGVAHEINNPIGFILSNLGSLQRYNEKLLTYLDAQAAALEQCGNSLNMSAIRAELADQKKALKIDFLRNDISSIIIESKDGADRVKKIVQDLKSFSHIDENEISMASVNDCIDRTLTILANEIKYKATVKTTYGELPPTRCNPGELGQVFMNIIVNAVHAIETLGTITIATQTEGGDIVVSITDTGSGMPPEVLNHIFEPFFTTKEVGEGTGLGLSISYDIIKKHGGDISVVSTPDIGTTFTIRIPVVNAESTTKP